MIVARRLFLGLCIGALLVVPACAQSPSQPTSASPQVLFVCEHGAAKSVIAVAHFNKLAQERGLPHRAITRGTNPDTNFAPKVVAGLQAEGLSAGPGKPQLVSDKDVLSAAKVVTLGCTIPQKASVTDWADLPSPSENYAAASSEIRQRVETLVNELAAKQKPEQR